MSFFKNFFRGHKKNGEVRYTKIDYSKYFENASIDGTSIEVLSLGDLSLPTGNIIACDPLVGLSDTRPFSRIVRPGRYPVTVCSAKTMTSGDRYAVVKLEFNKIRPEKWEMAFSDKADIAELGKDEFIGFPVDAGLGCLCDDETQRFYKDFVAGFFKANPTANIYDDFFAAEFKKNALIPDDPNDIGDWLNFSLPNQPVLNVIMFHSGYGDGVYPCYWGIAGDGTVCSLMVDFQVL